jgi:hypothetical protein
MKGGFMRPALLMAFIFVCSSVADAQESVLDRRITADAPGAAVVWLPDGISSGMFAWRLADSAGIPLVFEASPLEYRDPAIVAQRLDLDGLTVRQALDALVAQDPRYHWEEHDGVLVIRPLGVLADPRDVLNQRIAGVRGDRVRLNEVLAAVTAAVAGRGAAQSVPAEIASQEFALDVPSGTVLDLLAAAARAHGRVMWLTPDAAQRPDQRGVSIGFRMFAGAGPGMPGDAAR